MKLIDLITRTSPPVPWEEGDNIPWHEPGFSKRMLKEHLCQDHDAASRRFKIIDQQVNWIHGSLLGCQPALILDLGCGPGLYAERFARLGHTVYGIDYSPASIEYAFATTKNEHLSCTFLCQDFRQAEFPHGMKLVMLIYGEFNIFRPTDAGKILDKAWQALDPGGTLLLEPHPYHIVKQLGEAAPSWYSSLGGLFSEQPHVVFKENFWDEVTNTTSIRYFVIDAQSKQISRYAQSFQAYRDEEYLALLTDHQFHNVKIIAGLSESESNPDLIVIVAHKP